MFLQTINSRSRLRTESNSLSVKITNSRHMLFLLIHHFSKTTFYNIHNPSSQAPTTLGCAWPVYQVKKRERNILNIRVSTYELSHYMRVFTLFLCSTFFSVPVIRSMIQSMIRLHSLGFLWMSVHCKLWCNRSQVLKPAFPRAWPKFSAHFVTQRCRETIICKLQGKSFYFLSLLIEKLHKVTLWSIAPSHLALLRSE